MVRATKEERQLVVTEVTERLKDIVWIRAEREVSKMLRSRGLNNILNEPSTDTMTFNFVVDMYDGDIQQIVARHRRNK